MSIEQITQVIPATGQIVFSSGNFFFLVSATGSVNVRIQKNVGNSEGANGISAGLVLARVEPWQQLTIVGTAGVSVTFYVGFETVREDITDIRSQIAVLGGTSLIAEAPSATLASPANLVTTTATSTNVAANLTRRRISVGSLSTNTGSVFIQAAGTNTASRGVELQPGQFIELMTTASFDVRNDSGANQTITLFEET